MALRLLLGEDAIGRNDVGGDATCILSPVVVGSLLDENDIGSYGTCTCGTVPVTD